MRKRLVLEKAPYHGFSSQPPCCPGPLKIEPTDSAVTIEHFPEKVKPGDQFRLHCSVVNFLKWNPSGGNFCHVPSTVTDNRKVKVSECIQYPISMGAWDLGHRRLRLTCLVPTEGFGKAIRDQG